MTASSFAALRARDVMQRDVVTVPATCDLGTALRIFEARGISGAPVVGPGGELVGVLSVKDIARVQAMHERRPGDVSGYYGLEATERGGAAPFPASDRTRAIPVAEAMTPVVIDASEDTPVARLAALMMELRIHRVIITRDRKLAGIVTTFDLLRLLGGEPVPRA